MFCKCATFLSHLFLFYKCIYSFTVIEYSYMVITTYYFLCFCCKHILLFILSVVQIKYVIYARVCFELLC